MIMSITFVVIVLLLHVIGKIVGSRSVNQAEM